MKLRNDFVTNSSSSSFVISRDNISKDKLIDILLEIVALDRKWYDDEEDYVEPTREEDYREGEDNDFYVTWHYHVTEATRDKPFTDIGDTMVYDNHFIIDNEGNIRYDWDNIYDIFDKYDLDFRRGYCD